MASGLAIALIVTLVLLGVVALSRRRLGPGRRRNVLSVALVLLGLGATFIVCFGGGFLAHRLRAEAQMQSSVSPPPAGPSAARPTA